MAALFSHVGLMGKPSPPFHTGAFAVQALASALTEDCGAVLVKLVPCASFVASHHCSLKSPEQAVNLAPNGNSKNRSFRFVGRVLQRPRRREPYAAVRLRVWRRAPCPTHSLAQPQS